MRWDAARDRARGYRARKPYKVVAPIGPDVTHLAGESHLVNGKVVHAEELRGLLGPGAVDLDGTCEGCGYKICSCVVPCVYCGEPGGREHDPRACSVKVGALVVEAYVTRKARIPAHIDPWFAVAILNQWARDAEASEYKGMTDQAIGWAIRWRLVHQNLHLDPPTFLGKLRRYIDLTLEGKTHLECEAQIAREAHEREQKKLEAVALGIAEAERRLTPPQAETPAYNFPVTSEARIRHVASQDVTFNSASTNFTLTPNT